MNRKFLVVLLVVLAVSLLVIGCGQKEAENNPPAQEQQEQDKQQAETPETPEVVEVSYVGSQTCKSCHNDKYSGWEKTLHTKMIQDAKANPEVIIGDFSKEGEPLSMAGVSKEDIKYTIGSKWKQRYVIEKDGALRILPMQWVVKTQEWTPYHKDDWQDRAYEDLCIACHSTGYNPEVKEFVEPGVGCEACHGPGSEHAKSGDKSKIVNPANLDPKLQVDVCGSCHNRGKNVDGSREDALGFKPGEKLADFYVSGTPETKPDWFHENGDSKKHHQQYNDFIQSKHYTTVNLTCSTCHDSHGLNSEGQQLVKPASELCASCHSDGKYTVEKNMPKRAKSATPGDITTHTFRTEYPVQ